METIKLTINGVEVKVNRGTTVLEAAQAANIYIPTLCADPDLEPYGSCRLCVVEIEKIRGLPTACTTPATNGMVVHTETPAVNEVRRTSVDLLIANHPMDCLTCRQNQQCELQQVTAHLGITERRFPRTDQAFPVDTSNPFFDLDRNYCILCAKCVRTCDEITGINAIDLAFRGYSARVATFGDKPLIESTCKSCGECMVRCPVAALTPKETRRPIHEVKTTCPYCGVGCGINLITQDGELVGSEPDFSAPSLGSLCVKGQFGSWDFINSDERLKTPLIKNAHGEFEPVSWDTALALISDKLKHYRDVNGPDSLVFWSSARTTSESNYLAQKFTRVALGTNNVDNCSRT